MDWPATERELVAAQEALAAQRPEPFVPADPTTLAIGGCFVCFPRGAPGPQAGEPARLGASGGASSGASGAAAAGERGEPGWAAAAVTRGSEVLALATASAEAGAPYVPGLLALREGPLLEAAVRALAVTPGVLLVDATGRDHPRRAGLATSLGACLDLPTVGITHRPLLAEGAWPPPARGATSPLRIGDEVVGGWLRVQPDARPLAVHPAWRTELDDAVAIVLAAAGRFRTPLPLREARHAARIARAGG